MSSYATVYLMGKAVHWYRNSVYPAARYAFAPDDLRVLKSDEAWPFAKFYYSPDELDPDELASLQLVVYEASAGSIKDRLDVMGYGIWVVREAFSDALQGKIDSYMRIAPHLEASLDPEEYARFREDAEYLRNLSFDRWLGDVTERVSGGPEFPEIDLYKKGPLTLVDGADERVIYRLLAEVVDDAEPFTLDVTDLSEESRLGSSTTAETWFPAGDAHPGPPIILTEGRTDARILGSSIKVLKPHLSGYVRFLDYDLGNEGGAAALVRMVKSFAAAGIANPILALFDNDSAGREAALGLKGTCLPPHFHVAHYPDLEMARSYPTLGPQGSSEINVNGLAGSIELYLGNDVLTKEDGALMPVQWKGYLGKVKSYQGEILEKGAIQKAFEDKLSVAQTDPAARESQDWSGIMAIVDDILATFRSPPSSR